MKSSMMHYVKEYKILWKEDCKIPKVSNFIWNGHTQA